MADTASHAPQLRELGDFLRTQRNSLDPQGFGISAGGTRGRVSGLRREEVAERACFSTDYYARIEQGRLAPSAPVLEALMRVLELDEDQVDYVSRLVEHAMHVAVAPRATTVRRSGGRQRVRPQLQRVLDQLTKTPAIVLGPRTDILAWNDLAERVYLKFSELPPRELNYVRLIFTNARMRALFEDWESVAQACVAILRREAASSPDDPALATLVGELTMADEQFGRWWATRNVERQDFGTKVLHHPAVGELVLDWDIFRYQSSPEQQLVIQSVEEGSPTQERLSRLLDLP